ncbi:tyrosine protein kinase [Cohnella xylanilytica]|uniref:non-specific protein-tyrosine kinase n=1 Tax=Cohnella xylanilytica TaxID=557555 RepID=A0A841U2H4_9BACL|nr:CpsD/CapB family tyrosine-protein kinase [Cohnella xylanilytica]MBB6692543.1 CpsD/CapB family tyrosine-protein kinase [Cohnella xylanilytica]GIO10637.1 tyrosine protein kinase [Cohnella xylanilytica]
MPRSIPRSKLFIDGGPGTAVSEAYRILRTNIEYAQGERRIKTIAISSSTQGEGKSATAANLAAAFADSKKKVLLVDANLRDPIQQSIFDVPNRHGLSTLLGGQDELGDVAVATTIPYLTLLPAGPIPSNPAELLGSERMAQLLEEAKPSYDVILIDTPAVLSFADAQIMAVQCDSVLMVAGKGTVKKKTLGKAASVLEQVNARVLGVALNEAR